MNGSHAKEWSTLSWTLSSRVSVFSMNDARSVPSRIERPRPRYHCASPMDLGTIVVRCPDRFYT